MRTGPLCKCASAQGERNQTPDNQSMNEFFRDNERTAATHVIRSDRIQLLDLVAERHRLVDDELEELVRCRFSGEQRELGEHGSGPGDDDADGDLRRERK